MTSDESLSIEIEVPGTPEEVWEAIATSHGISAWFVPSEVEEREGGKVVFHLADDLDSAGVVTGWEPPGRFAYEESWPVDGREPASLATEFLVEARAGGTCVVRAVSTFSEPGFAGDLENMSKGWTAFLDNLRLYLTHFAGQPAAAVQLTAAPDISQQSAWLMALGDLDLGELTVGAAALGGVVERLSADELLVRRPSALLGLSVFAWDAQTMVAVRATCYGPAAADDASRERAVWQEWLDATYGVLQG